MTRNLDRTAAASGDLEAWLYPTVNPGMYIARLDTSVRCKAMDLENLSMNRLFDGHPFARGWIVDESVASGALSHGRTSRDDDQVAVLEPARHPVQVVEARRDADDPLSALHLQRDPLHRGSEQVVEPRQLALVPVVGDAEHQ